MTEVVKALYNCAFTIWNSLVGIAMTLFTTSIIKKHKESTDSKLLSEAEFVTRFGAIENKSLLYKMDRLILTSGIKNKLPWINGEVFIIGMSGLAIAGFFEGVTFFSNFFVAIFLAAAQAVALYVIVKGVSGRTYNQIEDATTIFISILSNHAKGSSDIVTIMQKTSVSLSGPLRGIVEKFVLDCESTGNIDVAFDYMKESVDNRQLQTIFVNLKNCMHYQANYEEVLVQMMGQVAAGLSARVVSIQRFDGRLSEKSISYKMVIALMDIYHGNLSIDEMENIEDSVQNNMVNVEQKIDSEIDIETKNKLDQVFKEFSKLELYIFMKEFGFLGDKIRKMTAKELSYQDYFVSMAREDKDGDKNIDFGNIQIKRPGRNSGCDEELFVESVYYVKEKFYSNKVAKIKRRLATLKDTVSMLDIEGCLEEYCMGLWKEKFLVMR